MHIFPAIMIKLNQREHLLISNPDSRCTELLPTCPCRCTSWTPVTTCAGTSTTAAACRSKASARPSTSTCTTERAWGGTSLSQSWISFAPWKRCWRGRHPIASTLPRCSSSMRERCAWCWNNYFYTSKFFLILEVFWFQLIPFVWPDFFFFFFFVCRNPRAPLSGNRRPPCHPQSPTVARPPMHPVKRTWARSQTQDPCPLRGLDWWLRPPHHLPLILPHKPRPLSQTATPSSHAPHRLIQNPPPQLPV